MGRPLIYICAVTIVVLGIIQIKLNDRHIALAKRTASYANVAQMRNLAHSGVELTLHKLREDITWRNGNQAYVVPLDYGTASIVIEDKSVNPALGDDQLRLISEVVMDGITTVLNYKVEIAYPELPNIPGALAFTNSDFLTDLGGSFYINGLDESGEDSVGLPGISVIDQASKDQIIAKDPTFQFLDQIDGNTGSGKEPSIGINPTMDFAPLAEMIDMLSPNATKLNGGPYTEDLGSPENPGVFLIDNYAKIAGKTNGYGIMIIRENADLDVETTLNAAGTFNFYGLIIFENSWGLDGQGNVTLHGTVVVGSPNEFTKTTTIDLTGNLSILYNSMALDYARKAATRGMPSSFKIIDVFE